MTNKEYNDGIKRLTAALANVPDGETIARGLVRLGLFDVSAASLGVLCHYLTGSPCEIVPAPKVAAPKPRRRRKMKAFE